MQPATVQVASVMKASFRARLCMPQSYGLGRVPAPGLGCPAAIR
jgi:hypothetical protein